MMSSHLRWPRTLPPLLSRTCGSSKPKPPPREAAESANRAKDEFLSVLSHELRTPLNAMLGWVRMLKPAYSTRRNSERALEVIERNTRLQSSLIEDLLDVSRIISGKMRIETELVDLVSVVQTVSETTKPLADCKGHYVSIHARR
jgi:signal transduction histidine kinase